MLFAATCDNRIVYAHNRVAANSRPAGNKHRFASDFNGLAVWSSCIAGTANWRSLRYVEPKTYPKRLMILCASRGSIVKVGCRLGDRVVARHKREHPQGDFADHAERMWHAGRDGDGVIDFDD